MNKIAQAFNKASRNYDAHAYLQREIGELLLHKLRFLQVDIESILDLGCGTGYFSHKLATIFPRAKVYGCDIACDMLRLAAQTYVSNRIEFIRGDAENLAYMPNNFDLIFSNCVLQWAQDLDLVFANIRHNLHNRGYLLFSIFIIGTLAELRKAWVEIDNYKHVNDFLTIKQIRDLLNGNDFAIMNIDMRQHTLQFDSVWGLVQYLRAIGANHVSRHRSKFIGRSAVSELERIYRRKFSCGKYVNATFNTVLVLARKQV